jgi:hypothetical protein
LTTPQEPEQAMDPRTVTQEQLSSSTISKWPCSLATEIAWLSETGFMGNCKGQFLEFLLNFYSADLIVS